VQNHYPKLYYTPDENRFDLDDCLLIDFTCVSDTYDAEQLHIMFMNSGISYDLEWVQVQFKNSNIHTKAYPLWGSDDVRTLEIGSLQEYADAIASCTNIVTLMSGAAVLASTIKGDTGKQRIDVLMAQDKPIFKFRNANYTVL
jgi:hypothetical protein